MSRQRHIVIGQALKPFGLKGEIKVKPFTVSLSAFTNSSVLLFQETPYRVLSTRQYGSNVLVLLEGVDSPEQARDLAGSLVKTDRQNLPAKEEDEYYWFELIGMKVVTVDGRQLGCITAITPTGANDVLHVQGAGGEVLLPMIEDVVLEIDVENDQMVVDPLEGLIPDA
jgi:16S rRNA processing protein RimM